MSKGRPLNFKKEIKRINRFANTLPEILGGTALKHFDDSFDKEGFLDKGRTKWKPSQRVKRYGGKTLQDTGRLRRSGKHTRLSRSRIRVDYNDAPYGKYNNSGTSRLPIRKFIGDSFSLRKKINKRIIRELKKVFK